MNKEEIRTYEEYQNHKNKENYFVRGYAKLGCYQGLDFYKELNESEKLLGITDVEAFEDYLVFIISHIRTLEKELKQYDNIIGNFMEYLDKNKLVLNNPAILDFYQAIKEMR